MIKRYLNCANFKRFLADFSFLFKTVNKSHGEFDLKLRDNYFNLYYKGFSLAKVTIRAQDYKISIHKKFANHIFDNDRRFTKKPNGDYCLFLISSALLHPFFQKKYLDKLCSNIKEVRHREEIVLEQMVITDNLERDDIFIIDRQVTEPGWDKRIDLLALKQTNGNKYHFLVIEVKLGNSSDLKTKVGSQLQGYIDHINQNFADWKKCYEENYRQIKQTNIFAKPSFTSIDIDNNTEGLVVVSGYSGIGKANIETLKTHYTNIQVKQFVNKL